MRVFNVRLAAILLVIAVVFGGGVYGLNKFFVRRNASFFKTQSEIAEKRAKEAAKENNATLEEKSMTDAIKYLNWYVGLMPKEYKDMEHLGILLADKAQKTVPMERNAFWNAYNMLERTVRLDPSRKEGRRRLVELAMFVGRHQDAKAHLEGYLLVDEPNNADLLEKLAQCQGGLREWPNARDSLKKAIANNPAQCTAYAKLAELLRHRLSKPKEADELMTKLVRVNPKSAKAHYYRAAYLFDSQLRQYDEALEEAKKARQLAPDDADVLLLAAQCNVVKRKFDDARDCLMHGIKLRPSDVQMYNSLFQVEIGAGKRDKAMAALTDGLKATDRDPHLLWLMANMLVDVKKMDEARRLIDEMRKTSYPKPLIGYVDARIEFSQQHWRAAVERLNDARALMASDPKRFGQQTLQLELWLAICYQQLGDREQQQQALLRALAIDPNCIPAKKAMADFSRRRGNYVETMKDLIDLERAGKLDAPGRLQLAQLLLLQTLRQDQKRRDWKPLEKLLDAVEKSLPDSPEVPVLRAQVLEAQGKVAKAEKLLQRTRDRFPKQVAPWKGLIARAVRDKNWSKAETLLAEAQKAMGDCVDLRLLGAQYIMVRGGVGVKDRLRELMEDEKNIPDGDRVRLWAGLLDSARMIGDTKLAGILADKIAKREPNNAEIRKFSFEQAGASGDIATAEKSLRDIESIVGQEDAYALFGHAVILCMQADKSKDAGPLLDKALDYLKKASDARKDWARVATLEGSIYRQQGKTDLALQSFLEGIELGDRTPAAVQQAVDILFRSQRFVEADRLLSKLLNEQRTLSPRLMQIAAECAMYLKDTPRALAMAKRAVPADSKVGRDQVWIGQMLGVFGRHAKARGQATEAAELLNDAEKALRRAVELEPKLPVAWKALVQFFALLDEQYKAEKAIEDAKTKIPIPADPSEELRQFLADCYEMVRNLDAAQEEYEAMLKASPQDMALVRRAVDFYNRVKKPKPATELLQAVLDGKIKGGALDAAWSRRELARLLGGTGKHADLKKAMGLVERNLSSPQASFADRQLLARLMATDPDPSEQACAKKIQMFESLGTAATPEDRFFLARLYVQTGNWIKAGDLLRGLIASNGREPRYLEYYIDELRNHNERSSARTYFDQLETLAPNSFGTASRKADMLIDVNKPLEAFDALKNYVDNVDAETRDRGIRIRLVAERLAELAAQWKLKNPNDKAVAAQGIDSAESLFRTFVRENPGQDLVLAVFLARHGKKDESLRILDESLQTGNVELFTQACEFILQDGKITKDQLEHLDKIVQSAEAKYERVPLLLTAMAVLRTRQGRYSDASDVYREILKKEPDHALALNNLAVMLALQGVKLDEALTSINRAIELRGAIGAFLDSRAVVYLAMNKPQEALDNLKNAIAEDETPERLFHLARAYLLAGDEAKAKETFRGAIKKGLTKESLQLLEQPAFDKLEEISKKK